VTAPRWSRRVVSAAGVSCLAVLAASPLAHAQGDADYPPRVPTAASGICVGDIPYLQYGVDFGSDEFVGDPMTITFDNPSGDDVVITTTVPPAGQAATVLWPGASEDPQDWPGWVLDENGQWVESTTDPGAFTRAPGGVAVTFATNPSLTTSVTYPPASAVCANPKNAPRAGDKEATAGVALARTGASVGSIGLAAGALVIGGAAAVTVARRRAGQGTS
jgi:hypothetical protein